MLLSKLCWIRNVLLKVFKPTGAQCIRLRYISGIGVPTVLPDGQQELQVIILTKLSRAGLGSTKYRDRFHGVKRAVH
jgi:hypothetical protein